jgi:lysophospholipase L1-like esterase
LSYNAAARKIADERPDIDYVEIGPLLMAGEFPGDHYVEDGVHLRPEGYRLWLPALNEALRRNLGEPACATPLATAAPAA